MVSLYDDEGRYYGEAIVDDSPPVPGEDFRLPYPVALSLFIRQVWPGTLMPPHLPPSVLAWNDRVVVNLALVAKKSRRKVDMLVLADALAEAGWNDELFLAYIRRNPQEARWVLDYILETPP